MEEGDQPRLLENVAPVPPPTESGNLPEPDDHHIILPGRDEAGPLLPASPTTPRMEPIFWLAILSNAATLGIAAAVFIPLSRAAARRLSVPRDDAERIAALEAELELATARVENAEDRLAFLERLLEKGADAALLASSEGDRERSLPGPPPA